MDIVLVLGLVAAACTTAAFLPQVVQAHRSRQTKDLSLVMYLLFSAGLVLWIAYGVILGSLPVVAANLLTLLLCAYLIYLKRKYG